MYPCTVVLPVSRSACIWTFWMIWKALIVLMTLVFHVDPCNECRKTWASFGWWCFQCQNSGTVVDQQGEEVGEAFLRFRHDTHCGHVLVESIFVQPEMRRRGIGHILVTHLRHRFPGHAITGTILDYQRDSARVALLFWRAAGAVHHRGNALGLTQAQRHDTNPSNYGFLIPCWTVEFRIEPVVPMSWNVGRS